MLFLHSSVLGLFLEIYNINKLLITILTGWNRLHDLVSLKLVIDFKSQKVLWSSQLELGGGGLLVLLDGDSVGVRKMLLFPPHNLDEFLQVLDFFGLMLK